MAVPGGAPTFSAEGPILAWLLGGDPAVAYATQRDLLGHDDPQLRRRIVEEGDASALLAARRADGHWGEGFYRPKWTSTHYTLLELAGLGVPSDHPACSESAMIRPHHPARWHFDVLRGLEVLRSALRYAKVPAGPLGPALELVRGWRRPDGTWAAASGWPGQSHVAYPKAGTPNPWVTLRALRVLATFRASTE